MNLSFRAAEQVLSDFRERFIEEINAKAVVWKLLHKHIISREALDRIYQAHWPTEENEILHDFLQRACTEEDLMVVCDILVAVTGTPKMQCLGKDMKRRLHTGK